MEAQRGICTNCGMAVDLPHECTPDHVLLGKTDWEVRRHHDQVELGVPTKLTPQEYRTLQEERQEARDRIKAAAIAKEEAIAAQQAAEEAARIAEEQRLAAEAEAARVAAMEGVGPIAEGEVVENPNG